VKLLDKLASVVVAGRAGVQRRHVEHGAAGRGSLEAYVDESHTKAMAILPLVRRPTDGVVENAPPPEFIALVIEQITDETFTQGMIRRIEVVRPLLSAMSNLIEHQSPF
jgi:hypothetical protein